MCICLQASTESYIQTFTENRAEAYTDYTHTQNAPHGPAPLTTEQPKQRNKKHNMVFYMMFYQIRI